MNKIKHITDAGMITGIIVVFLLISRLTGGAFEELLTFMLPIPLALYTLKYDAKKGIVPLVAISLISFFVISPIKAACYILPANIVGLIYGSVLKTKINTSLKILVAIMGAIVINVLTTVIFSKLIFGFTIIEDTKVLVAEIIKILEQAGIKQINLVIFESIMLGLIPSIIIITSIMEGILTHFCVTLLAEKVYRINLGRAFLGFKLSVPKIATFIVLPIMIGALIYLSRFLSSNGEMHIIFVISLNITIVFMILYALQGSMVTALYFRQTNRQFLQILVVLSVFVFPYAIATVGALDSIFDLKMRILLRKQKNKSNE